MKSVEALNSGISAALTISIATRGIGAAATSLILAIGLHRFADTEQEEEACFGPYVPTKTTTGIGGPARLVGWIAVVVIGFAALGGYVALATFLTDQLIWATCILVLLYLLVQSVDTFLGKALTDESRLATALQANTGLRKRSLNQISVLATGGARVVLILVAALLILAPWGLDSTDITASMRSAFFGFQVGGVTISLSSIVLGIGVLAIGVIVTRAIQRWLDQTYLPATDLDAGLRNSISTVAGYCGFLLSLALAFSYLGLSLEKITIVAGALSVGIGFGLQSIVNNFVSGLLLLWERPIRVGDQVVIGDSEGIVKRISVRSTEIQTFDRSAVIVPNSNLISGIVKNRVRGDRTGRLSLTVNVLRNQDPCRAAELITGCADAHPNVVRDPPPRVVFRKIGDTFLEFELLAWISDVSLGLKVQTDLNFAVFRTLTEQGLIPPMGPGSSIVTIQGSTGCRARWARSPRPSCARPRRRRRARRRRRRPRPRRSRRACASHAASRPRRGRGRPCCGRIPWRHRAPRRRGRRGPAWCPPPPGRCPRRRRPSGEGRHGRRAARGRRRWRCPGRAGRRDRPGAGQHGELVAAEPRHEVGPLQIRASRAAARFRQASPPHGRGGR